MRGETTKMRKVAAISGAMVVAVVGVAALGGCGSSSGQETQASSEVYPVVTAPVEYTEFSPVLTYKATVIPERKAMLGAVLTGRIQKYHVDIGDRVEAGELLVELAGDQLTQAESQYRSAEKDWERMSALLKDGAVTQQAFDHTEAAYTAAKAGYESVLESARIRAPFAGVVTAKYLDDGELYTVMPTGAGSPAVLEVADLDSMKVQIEVSEKERRYARTGLDATIRIDDYPDEVFHGTISRIAPGLSLASRTSSADIVLANPQGKLRPGMFADVDLKLSSRHGILIPRDALVRQEGTGSFFTYVVSDGVAHRRNLTLGEGLGAQIEVLKGLSDGEEVVTAGRYKLHDGVSVLQGAAVADTSDVGAPADAGSSAEGGRR